MRKFLKLKKAQEAFEAEMKKKDKDFVPKPKLKPTGGNPNMLKK